ncbi:MAG: BadF/BadG/BcrA/BcrD ATPase family protein [Gemmatimonadota bacterium]
MKRIVVGVDAGGTKTAAIVGDGHTILGRADGPAGVIRPGRALVAASAIADTIRRALSASNQLQADVLVVGAAGAGRAAEREELERALRSEHIAARVRVTTDIEIALSAAFGRGPGIVISAGTGSIAIARTASGELHRSGGYGWQMGDEGSGYAIGRAALSALSRAADGRGPLTNLTPRIITALRVADFDGLITWAVTATPSEVSALSPVVLDVAAESDVVAQGITDYAARELSQLVLSLLRHFGPDEIVQVALAGGILTPERPLRTMVLSRLTEEQRLSVIRFSIEAALGALHLAEKLSEEPG